MERFVPASTWLRGYERRFAARDFAGGLAVGFMLIPQGLAFAQLVRVPAVTGLWSGAAAMIGYAVFGPSRHLVVGPEAGTAMMSPPCSRRRAWNLRSSGSPGLRFSR